MKHVVLAAFLLTGPLGAARAGTIIGTVRAAPPQAPGQQSGDGGDAYASRRYKFVEKIDYARLHDFVIYIDQAVAEPVTAPDKKTVTTTQRDANFEPHVLPVMVGTTVRWPNEDDIFHNVFSMSDAKSFDLGYYKKGERPPEVLFDKVGKVDVFCAIHSRMHCIILVLPNPYFAKADDRGRFEIKGVPAGTYRVTAWHERLPAKSMELTVPADGAVTADFVLSVAALPRY